MAVVGPTTSKQNPLLEMGSVSAFASGASYDKRSQSWNKLMEVRYLAESKT